MALSNEKMSEELSELIRFDYDAIGAYTTAIDDIKEAAVRDPLVRFREDHERHVVELSAIVRRLGGTPPDKPDFKGFMRKTMTKVAGLGGTEGTLKAMKSNEEVLNKTYSHHLTFEWPADIRAVIERNYSDEKRHLTWVEQALQTRTWESSRTASHSSAR
jgi:uncharacterized protein (TIGR02284 family)